MSNTSPRSALFATSVAALAAASLLGGCASHSSRHFAVGSTPASYKQVHPIVLDERQRVLDVPVGAASGGMTTSARRAVEAFARDFHREKGAGMQLLVPDGSKNTHVARKVTNTIADVLRREGVPAHAVHVADYDARSHGSAAPVRIAYRALTARVDGCGKWDKDLATNPENANYHNFGCATQNNLAEMVDNPADLLRPRASALIEPARRTSVIGNYISGERTGSASDYAPSKSAL